MGEKELQPEEIKSRLREAEARLAKGQTIAQVCRKFGITEKTFDAWRKKYGEAKKDKAKQSWLPELTGKQIAIGAALIVVIIAAIVVAQKRVTSKPDAPDWVLQAPTAKIDTKTLEIVTLPAGDWMGKYAPDASGLWKNPKTGEYTMANIITCMQCHKQIPEMPIPLEVRQMTDPLKEAEARQKLQAAYVCPFCKKSPF